MCLAEIEVLRAAWTGRWEEIQGKNTRVVDFIGGIIQQLCSIQSWCRKRSDSNGCGYDCEGILKHFQCGNRCDWDGCASAD
jgi:hypothetical protein